MMCYIYYTIHIITSCAVFTNNLVLLKLMYKKGTYQTGIIKLPSINFQSVFQHTFSDKFLKKGTKAL